MTPTFSTIVALKTRAGSFRINLAGDPNRVDLLVPRLQTLALESASPKDALDMFEQALLGTGAYIADVFDVGPDAPPFELLAAIHEVARKSNTAQDAFERLKRVFQLAEPDQVTATFGQEDANWAREYVREVLDDMDEARPEAAADLRGLLGEVNYYLIVGEA